MSERADLVVDGSGARPVITKTARDAASRARLAHEVAMLEAAQHPGVATLLGVDDEPNTGDDGGPTLRLRTAFCGSRTLATTGAMSVARVAGTMAALATTVADLHDLGLVHRRLTADHVLIGTDGRPVLCGFAEAARADEAATGARPDDVKALGELLRSLLVPHDDLAPIPASRLGRRGAWAGYQRRALLNLADQATSDEPHLRPSARSFAQNLRATVPDATLVDRHDGGSGPRSTVDGPDDAPASLRRLVSDRRAKVAALAAAGVLVLTAGVVLVDTSSDDHGADPARVELEVVSGPGSDAPAPDIEPLPAASSTTTSTTTGSTPSSTSPDTPSDDEAGADPDARGPSHDPRSAAAGCATLGADEDASPATPATLANGHPCPVALTYGQGVLIVGDEQFGLGLPDAAVAVGDFTCRGAAEAAVLDRTSGHVFVFDTWADGEGPVTTSALRRIDGGARLLAEPVGAAGCHRLVALDAYGIRHLIALEDPTS